MTARRSVTSEDALGLGPSVPLRVALVGAGRMARQHATVVRRLDARVVAVADPDPSARRRAEEWLPDSVAYPTLSELLDSEPVDVVHVCSPPGDHERSAALALESGCHVYVEKPFAQTTSAAERLYDLADEMNLILTPGHQLLFEDPTDRLRRLIPALGEAVHLNSYFSFRPSRRTTGLPSLSGDAQLLDVLPHPAYLLLDFMTRLDGDTSSSPAHVESGRHGTVLALVRRGSLTGSLIISLAARPIESYLEIVGTNGSIRADYVRGIVLRSLGPGTSSIDKAFQPFRMARQLGTKSAGALLRRATGGQGSYPGLQRAIAAFHEAVELGTGPPISRESTVETVGLCSQVAEAIQGAASARLPSDAPAEDRGSTAAPRVLVSGGTGYLGRRLVRELRDRGQRVIALSRREPAPWERLPGVEYRVLDLGGALDAELPSADLVIHCAAETAGGWEAHERNSIRATERLLRAAAVAKIPRAVHVSSLAVLDESTEAATSETTPLVEDARAHGPYVWGKAESERIATELSEMLGISLRIVRPGPLVESAVFSPPGRLGRRVGNLFIAVGSGSEQVPVTDVDFAARALAWIALHFEDAPGILNLLAPELPTRKDLVRKLKGQNPDLRVAWLPRFLLHPLSWSATLLQKMVRPGRPAMSVAGAFRSGRYDTGLAARVADLLEEG